MLQKGLLFLAMLVTCLAANVHHYIFYPPYSIHIWRQADSAAQFKNYYQNDISFWTPQLMNVAGLHGYQASEFPITYYLAAQLARLFGFTEAWIRGLHLGLFFLALYFFYLLCCMVIKNRWLALLPPLFFLTAPWVFYYANNFLPNVPAISLAVIGWYCTFRYLRGHSPWMIGALTLLFTLSAVIRPSEGIHFIAAFLLLLYDAVLVREPEQRPRVRGLRFAGLAAVAVVFVAGLLGWIEYVKNFNDTYGNHMSLWGILPVWNVSDNDYDYTNHVLRTHWRLAMHNDAMWMFLPIAFIALFFRRRVYRSYYFYATLLLLGGSLAYAVLFYGAFMIHDYYLLTFSVFPAFVFMSFFAAYEDLLTRRRVWPVAAVLMTALVGYDVYYNGYIQRKRFETEETGFKDAYYSIEPYLRSLGVDREDLVLSVPDVTPNVSLYLLNQQGFTDAFRGEPVNELQPYIDAGVKYLVVGDTSVYSRPGLEIPRERKIGEYLGIEIYRIGKE